MAESTQHPCSSFQLLTFFSVSASLTLLPAIFSSLDGRRLQVGEEERPMVLLLSAGGQGPESDAGEAGCTCPKDCGCHSLAQSHSPVQHAPLGGCAGQLPRCSIVQHCHIYVFSGTSVNLLRAVHLVRGHSAL